MVKYADGFDAEADYRIKKARKLVRHHAEGRHGGTPNQQCPDCKQATREEERVTREPLGPVTLTGDEETAASRLREMAAVVASDFDWVGTDLLEIAKELEAERDSRLTKEQVREKLLSAPVKEIVTGMLYRRGVGDPDAGAHNVLVAIRDASFGDDQPSKGGDAQ